MNLRVRDRVNAKEKPIPYVKETLADRCLKERASVNKREIVYLKER